MVFSIRLFPLDAAASGFATLQHFGIAGKPVVLDARQCLLACLASPESASHVSSSTVDLSVCHGSRLTVVDIVRNAFALLAIDGASVLLLANSGDAACTIGDGPVPVDAGTLRYQISCDHWRDSLVRSAGKSHGYKGKDCSDGELHVDSTRLV